MKSGMRSLNLEDTNVSLINLFFDKVSEATDLTELNLNGV